MMRRTPWVRAASAVAFLLAVGHSLGGLDGWSPVGGNPALAAMKAVRFDVYGSDRSYFEMYFGFGLSISFLLFQQAFLIWASSTRLMSTRGSRLSILVCAATCCLSAVACWKYLFSLPAMCFATIAVLLAIASMLPSGASVGGSPMDRTTPEGRTGPEP